MNKLPECERPSVSLLACRRAQHATPQPKRSADCPRSRGVYALARGTVDGVVGSSPLARGLPGLFSRQGHLPRIIPARAGFTKAAGIELVEAGDHPRSRGVYDDHGRGRDDVAGSSPLARGLPVAASLEARTHGIIPARAGFTRREPSRQCREEDHPRSRGVYSWPGLAWSWVGDHPRSRGVYTCGSLESQRRATLPDRVHLHCRPSARSAEFR